MTTIYILFREQSDQSRLPSKEYINGFDSPLDDGASVLEEFNKGMEIIEFFDYEYAIRLYDESNLNGLLYQTIELEEEYPGFATNIRTQLRSHGFTDWEDIPFERTSEIRYNGSDVTSHMLGDIAYRHRHSGHAVLVNVGAIDCAANCITVGCFSERLTLPVVRTIHQLHEWLSVNRDPQRIYNFNRKHGDAHHRSETYTDGQRKSHRAAQLETTEEETKALLKLAVGRTREAELWYLDENRGKFIYFENQNTFPPSFHAYHLSEGESNYENINVEKLRKVQ